MCSHRSALTFIAASLLLTGCSGSKGPATAPVSGTVTYNGVPLEGATVVFSAAGGEFGKPATGVTDGEGHYKLMLGDKEGAVPGSYIVTVAKGQVGGSTMSDEERYKFIEEHEGANPPEPESKNLLPEKYLSPSTSDLNVTVEAGKKNDIPLTLTD